MPDTRRRLFAAASHLFYRFGFQAVGIDKIVEESGVSKMTLYRHFPSKDDLIVAYLQEAAHEFWAWFEEAASREQDAKAKLLSVFSALEDRCRSAKCLGCTFQNAAAEFPNRDHAVNKTAREHKEEVRGRVESMVREVGASDVNAVTNQLMLVLEGSLAAVRTLSLPTPGREAGSSARKIIEEGGS